MLIHSAPHQSVDLRLGVDIALLHSIERQRPDVGVAGAVGVVLCQGTLHLRPAHRVQGRGDGETDNGGIRYHDVHNHGELAGHAAIRGHLFCVGGVADGNERAVIVKEAHLTDGETTHAVINGDFHINHVGVGGADCGAGHIALPLFAPEGGLGHGGLIILTAAVTGSSSLDVDLAAVQDALGD